MQVYDELSVLARAIRESDACRDFRQLKEEVEANEADRALIREYKRLQLQLQLAAVAGAETRDEEGQRFQQLGALLFAQERTSRFLLAEMRLQQMMADVYKALNDAAGLDMNLPGV